MERSPMVLGRWDQHNKNYHLNRSNLHIECNPIKIPPQFCTNFEIKILDIIWKKKSQDSRTILYNKGASTRITIFDLKLYYRATVIKQLHSSIKKAMDQQNPLILIHTPINTWFLSKKPKLYNGKKKASSTNGAGITECRNVEEYKEIHIYSHAQNSSPNVSTIST